MLIKLIALLSVELSVAEVLTLSAPVNFLLFPLLLKMSYILKRITFFLLKHFLIQVELTYNAVLASVIVK